MDNAKSQKIFFSIVIPAHNEEKYLAHTLDLISRLEYPADRFETLVVENGSKDLTFEIAKSFESGNLKVYQSEKGASRAKNFGIHKTDAKSQWIVLLDADTELLPKFLAELDVYLRAKGEDLSIGTTTVLPQGKKRFKADFWFLLSITRRTCSRKLLLPYRIMNAKYRNDVKFDITRNFAEDLKLNEDLRKLGKFFYFKTRQVVTSTRRFDEVGWFRLFLRWNWQALVLAKSQKAGDEYEVIR